MTSTPTEALTKAEKELEATAFAYAATAKPEHRSEILDRLSVPGVCLFLLDAVSLLKRADETHALEPAEVADRLPKKTKSKLGETKSGKNFLSGTNPGFGEGEEALEQLEERRAERKVFANLTAAIEGRTELEDMRKLAASLKTFEDKEALGVLKKNIDAKSAAVRALFTRVAAPPSSDGEEDLKALWKEHKEQRLQKDEFATHEALMLSPRRGKLGRWFNDWFGPAGALEGGRTLMVGAPPGTGKTGFASMLAADAMESGCPVLFAQMELSVPETLEHVAAQAWPHTGTKTAPSTADSSRSRLSDFQFPATWLSLLRVTYPSPLCNEEVLRSDRILWRESGIYTRRPPGSMEAIIWDMRRLAS